MNPPLPCLRRPLAGLLLLIFALTATTLCLPTAAEAAWDPFGSRAKRENAELRSELNELRASTEAATTLAENNAPDANLREGDEARNARRGITSVQAVKFGPNGDIATYDSFTNVDSTANYTGASSVTIRVNESRRVEIGDKQYVWPVGVDIIVGSVGAADLATPAAATYAGRTTYEAARAQTIAATAQGAALLLQTTYNGQADVVTARGEARRTVISARAGGIAQVLGAAADGTRTVVDAIVTALPVPAGIGAGERVLGQVLARPIVARDAQGNPSALGPEISAPLVVPDSTGTPAPAPASTEAPPAPSAPANVPAPSP